MSESEGNFSLLIDENCILGASYKIFKQIPVGALHYGKYFASKSNTSK